MKLLLDQNLSHRLVPPLVNNYRGTIHVRDVALACADDEEVWDYAKHHGFTIMSKDDDFERLSLAKGAPPKVIWLRIGNVSTSVIQSLLQANQQIISDFDSDSSTSLLILP